MHGRKTSESLSAKFVNPLQEAANGADDERSGENDAARIGPAHGLADDHSQTYRQLKFGQPDINSSIYSSADVFNKLREDATGKPCWTKLLGEHTDLMRWCFNYSFDPNASGRQAWDMCMLVLVLYSVVVTPFGLAFARGSDGRESSLETFVDFIFWCDVVVNFWTGYDQGFEIVKERGKIAKHYLTGWFVIDLTATVQWEIVYSWTTESNAGTIDRGNVRDEKYIEVLRLIKVLRLLRLGRLVDRLTAGRRVNAAYIDALMFFSYVFMMAHLLACFFYLCPMVFECQSDASLSLWTEGSVAAEALSCSKDPGSCDGSIATGWYVPYTCMQGSWRQEYGLEQICESAVDETVLSAKLEACQKMAELHLQPWDVAILNLNKVAENGPEKVSVEKYADRGPTAPHTSYEAHVEAVRSRHAHRLNSTGYELFVAPESMCRLCMSPMRLYLDAIYWAVTTMTTIGYGDRGPKTETEIVFTLFAEVAGFSVFALLLDRITKLAEALGEDSQKQKHEKNVVVEYLSSQNLPPKLIKEAVKFLKFRANSLSGRKFDPAAPEFAGLSRGLKEEIQHQIYMPVLHHVHFFGHHTMDRQETIRCKKEFDHILSRRDLGATDDTSISKQEMREFLEALGLRVSDNDYDRVFNEIDRKNTGSVSYKHFHRWWFREKTGRPVGLPFPNAFMNALCTKLRSHAFAPRDEIISAGGYGNDLMIINRGETVVYHAHQSELQSCYYHARVDTWHDDEMQREAAFIGAEDAEPVVGFCSFLPYQKWRVVRLCTADWIVRAIACVDTVCISRADILDCFKKTWPDGLEIIIDDAYELYHMIHIDAAMLASSPTSEETIDQFMSKHHPEIHSARWESLKAPDLHVLAEIPIEARVGHMELKLTVMDEKIDRVMDTLARIEAATATKSLEALRE